MRTALRAIGVVWIMTSLAVVPALAAPEDVANEVAREIMSPYCEGVTLHDCPSQPAAELRARIVRWAEAGWSKDRIIDHLTSEDQWGEMIRAAPPAEGTGLLAWVLPGFIVAVGVTVVAVVATTWAKRRRVQPPPPPVSAADKSRLDQELAQLRNEA